MKMKGRDIGASASSENHRRDKLSTNCRCFVIICDRVDTKCRVPESIVLGNDERSVSKKLHSSISMKLIRLSNVLVSGIVNFLTL